jgi:dipeptidyl aminopeptidase/acylaminoacyl peptidase
MPGENPGFWLSISPISYVGDISGPLQLHHGTKDTDVPYQYSVTLDGALKAVGKTVEFYSYPGSDHNLLGRAFGDAITRTIRFFDQYVKNAP